MHPRTHTCPPTRPPVRTHAHIRFPPPHPHIPTYLRTHTRRHIYPCTHIPTHTHARTHARTHTGIQCNVHDVNVSYSRHVVVERIVICNDHDNHLQKSEKTFQKTRTGGDESQTGQNGQGDVDAMDQGKEDELCEIPFSFFKHPMWEIRCTPVGYDSSCFPHVLYRPK